MWPFPDRPPPFRHWETVPVPGMQAHVLVAWRDLLLTIGTSARVHYYQRKPTDTDAEWANMRKRCEEKPSLLELAYGFWLPPEREHPLCLEVRDCALFCRTTKGVWSLSLNSGYPPCDMPLVGHIVNELGA